MFRIDDVCWESRQFVGGPPTRGWPADRRSRGPCRRTAPGNLHPNEQSQRPVHRAAAIASYTIQLKHTAHSLAALSLLKP